MTFLLDHIMVSIDQVKSLFPVQQHEHLKDVVMNLLNRFHAAVLPQFIPITQLNVGKTSLVIVL